MEKQRAHAAIIVAVTAVLMAGACSGAPSDKPAQSAASATPITLRIGTNDNPDTPGTNEINHFAAEVMQISHGQLTIEPVWGAAGEIKSWDQVVARQVVAGDLEMGLIPARAWDTERVTSLRALQAPFLFTSNDMVGKVVKADVANEMLAGLDQGGVTGLALVPESLRETFSFGKPFLTLRDFNGATIRAPRSDTSAKVYKALGATADDLAGDEYNAAIANGTVDAAESSLPASISVPTTATANLVLYPKINSIVANKAKFAQLSQEQQHALRQAATNTRDWGITAMIDPATGAAQYCKDGGTVVNTTERNLADMQTATKSVYAELEKDPQTRSFIDQIRALKSDSATPTRVTPCKP